MTATAAVAPAAPPQAAAEQQGQQIQVPERPRLAPGVELHGEMKESAYENPPWLIERRGVYLTVSRLLHAVAECLDGRRTLAEVADAVSDRIERDVTADNIAQLLSGLIASGIVVDASGKVAEVESANARSPSPLAMNMKMAMFHPGLIDRASRVLKVLYWPPVLLLLLAVGAAAEFWIYFIHGIGGSLHEALYAPGFILVVLTAIILAAGFHEFGHAAALRYGGGRAKAMGAGFYLFYPAFYTDVTDNYRLPRWSRLRTDLGGFYFHLIFGLLTMGLYAAIGWEPLLLVVVLINLEILHQLMPFVRLDGYWTLADVTGIPDFFSFIGPFLRSLVPLPFWKGRTMPPLKLWARLVFILYILITIPVLLLVMIHIIGALPRVLATSWDSLQQQWAAVQSAVGHGEPLLVASSIAQILVLILITGGLIFFIVTMARRLISKVWAWSAPSWPRRIAGATASIAAVAVAAVLFAPPLPIIGNQPGPLAGMFNFTPIGPNDTLTLPEMSDGAFGLGGANNGDSTPDASASPLASPSGTPRASASGRPGATTTAQPNTTATPGTTSQPTGTATRTPTATATTAPTTRPTASPTASPVRTPSPSPTSTSSSVLSPTPSP